MNQDLNIIWLKRDLRTQDHKSFEFCEKQNTNYIIIYIFEPSILNYGDISTRHLQFVYHSILHMNSILKVYNKEVLIFHEEAINVFNFLSNKFPIKNVLSYQETGIKISWERDLKIKNFLKYKNINWNQFPRDGIMRGISNRNNWDYNFYKFVNSDLTVNSFRERKKISFDNPFKIKKKLYEILKQYPLQYQKPGELYGWKYLVSFCEERFETYNINISKPKKSRLSCSRLSPFISWGNLSIKQIFHYIKSHKNFNIYKRNFNSVLSRLKWNCHFIQKFESECDYELKCVNRGYESLVYSNNYELLNKWKTGFTGFPLVDASMRCLIHTGWINFRMRAMLVSVLCHHFDCNWKLGVYHLSKLFLDYEPGIHYTQFQMQAGTTGINTIRMYNPVKQSKDHDNDGSFIKDWVSELSEIPDKFIHEPWKLTPIDYDIDKLTYPKPCIDIKKSANIARKKIWSHRKNNLVKLENKRIINLHTRNNEIIKKRN